jgi:glycosyltransferase involved in cell wall biosynthesis
MNILINCSNLKIGGGLQVAHSFLYELLKYPQHKYIVLLSQQMSGIINETDFGQNFIFIHYSIQFSWRGKNTFLDNIVTKHKVEKVFTVFGPAYWKPKVFHVCGYAKPQYVYKESPFFTQLPLKEKMKLKIKELIHLHSFRQAQLLITENEDVTERLKKIIRDKKIVTITNNYNQIFDNGKLGDKSIRLPEYEGLTLLTVSANYPHKNLQTIPKVISCLIKNNPELKFRFVLTLTEQQFGLKPDKDIRNHILFIGKVSINQCPYLYEQSDFLFLPTLLECFSASYAEAMRMQKPILTSDLDFAKGLCGDAALYFNPLSVQDIAAKIVMLAGSKQLQNNLIENGNKQLLKFDNYKERAKKYLEVIENANSG